MRQILTFICLLVCTVTSSFSAEIASDQTQAKEHLAVLDLETVGPVNPSLSKPLSDCVRREVVRSGRYKVLERVKMHEILKEQAFQLSGCVETSCAVKAGQLLGVGKIIIGSLGLVGQTYYLSLSQVDVETGEIEAVEEERCRCEEDRLIDSAKLVARRLMGESSSGATPASKPSAKELRLEPVYEPATKVPEPPVSSEINLDITNKYPKALEYWGIDPTTPEGYIDIPMNDLTIRGAAAAINMMRKGLFGEKAKQAVEEQFAVDSKRTEFDVAEVLQNKMKDGSLPSFPMFLPKSDAYAQWYQQQFAKKRAITPETRPKNLPTYQDSLTGMEFVLVPAGRFTMGSPSPEPERGENEGPQHEVTLSHPFYMGKYEVTQAQWQAVMGNNPSRFQGCDQCPVEQVSWNDIQEFIRRLNERAEITGYRLPTEAEWEYACRSGSQSAYSFGDDAGSLEWYAWHGGNSSSKTHPVGQKRGNAWGLYDMHGNVYEWCQDRYGPYDSGSLTDPTGPNSGSSRVIRGGSWGIDPRLLRCSDRIGGGPSARYDDDGFRLVFSFRQ